MDAEGDMRKMVVRLAIIAGVCAGNTSTSSADTLTITGGFLDISGSPTSFAHVGTLELSGERGFTLSAVVNGAFGRYEPGDNCHMGCAAGSTLDLLASWTGGDVGRPRATLEGVTYTDLNRADSRSGVSVEFTGTATLPNVLSPSAVVSAPFTFSGVFGVGDGPPSLQGRYDLFGIGTATIFLSSVLPGVPQPGWGVTRVRYEFAPIPEPATLLLLGAGVGGMVLRRVRRAHH
jgi:hypothetical protein